MKVVCFTEKNKFCFLVGSGTESDSDDSVPELEEQDSAQTQTQQAQVKVHSCPLFSVLNEINIKMYFIEGSSVMINTVTFVLLSLLKPTFLS